MIEAACLQLTEVQPLPDIRQAGSLALPKLHLANLADTGIQVRFNIDSLG